MCMSSQPAFTTPDKGHSLTYELFLEEELRARHCDGYQANEMLKQGLCHE